MTTTPDLLPVGTLVTLLADTFGEYALTGEIAGHIVYAHPETGAPQLGYAIHLDQGGYLDSPTTPPGLRPWIGTIVAHADGVERLMPDLSHDPAFAGDPWDLGRGPGA